MEKCSACNKPAKKLRDIEGARICSSCVEKMYPGIPEEQTYPNKEAVYPATPYHPSARAARLAKRIIVLEMLSSVAPKAKIKASEEYFNAWGALPYNVMVSLAKGIGEALTDVVSFGIDLGTGHPLKALSTLLGGSLRFLKNILWGPIRSTHSIAMERSDIPMEFRKAFKEFCQHLSSVSKHLSSPAKQKASIAIINNINQTAAPAAVKQDMSNSVVQALSA